MFGYSEEEALILSLQDIHPPDEVPTDLQRFDAAGQGLVRINEDRPCLGKDGSIFYADITGHRIICEGQPCLLGLFRDVTERRRATAALAESEEVKKCVETGKIRQLEMDYVRPDGGITPIEINATCLETIEGRRIMALHRDITERKNAQEASYFRATQIAILFGSSTDTLPLSPPDGPP
jgi:PAS domain-containing protein